MNKIHKSLLSDNDIRKMHEIEGNPFTPEDEAMFAMFDRKGWNTEKRLEYIRQQALDEADAHVAAE